jgi:hypothetical protein
MHTSVLKNDYLEIEYLRDPLRIIGLTPAGKTNMLIDLTNLPSVPTPFGDFHFCGGHRICNGGPETIELSDPSFVRQTLSIEQRF